MAQGISGQQAAGEAEVLGEAVEALGALAARLPECSPWRSAFEAIAGDVAAYRERLG